MTRVWSVDDDRRLYDEDHEAFRGSVRGFADTVLRANYERYRAERAIDREAWLAAGGLGLLGLHVPETYGGQAADDYRFTAVVHEELAKVSVGISSAFGIHCDTVAPYLVELCTDAQKERWLPRFCSGEMITAIGMTEPSGGSDLGNLRTTARRTAAGWLINGSKTFITNGFRSDLTLVAARTAEGKASQSISLFAVEEGTPGFSRGRKLDKVGQPEADTAELFFSDAEIPADNLVGELGRGFVHMMERLPQERIFGAITNITHAADLLAETITYAQERIAFGQPIGSFQANRFRIAELVTAVDVAQAYLDRCILAHMEGRLSSSAAAKAKWWTAEVQNEVLDACVQLHGGAGYMTEYRVAQAWMDARVTKIWAGSNEIMKELIGREIGL
jgi:alkylation response protein AidB-like acyl-CoA dehydrogenase